MWTELGWLLMGVVLGHVGSQWLSYKHLSFTAFHYVVMSVLEQKGHQAWHRLCTLLRCGHKRVRTHPPRPHPTHQFRQMLPLLKSIPAETWTGLARGLWQSSSATLSPLPLPFPHRSALASDPSAVAPSVAVPSAESGWTRRPLRHPSVHLLSEK